MPQNAIVWKEGTAISDSMSRLNVSMVIVPIGSFQEWRMQVRQFRLHAEVGSTYTFPIVGSAGCSIKPCCV